MPSRPCDRVWFNVKLQAVSEASKAKRLVQVLRTGSKQRQPFWQVEGVSMPMKYGESGSVRPKECVAFSLRSHFHKSETDFRTMPGKHSRPESAREQLGPQTQAKYRTIAPNKLGDEAGLFGQKGMLICFISTHGTAHHNQALNLFGPRKASSQIQASNICVQASRVSFGRDQSGALPRHVLQYCPSTSHGIVFGVRSLLLPLPSDEGQAPPEAALPTPLQPRIRACRRNAR